MPALPLNIQQGLEMPFSLSPEQINFFRENETGAIA